jgi:hypothetical protein
MTRLEERKYDMLETTIAGKLAETGRATRSPPPDISSIAKARNGAEGSSKRPSMR